MAIVVSVVLGPKLFTSGSPAEPPPELFVAAGSPDLAVLATNQPRRPTGPSSTVALAPSTLVPETTTTTAPPPSTTTSTTAKARRRPTTTTTAPPATTTTTAASRPTTTTTVPPPPPPPPAPQVGQDDRTQQGDVSWYDLPGTTPGVCAHRSLAKGTVVTVTNLDTGKSLTCTVNDRGPFTDDGKILDLARDDFTKLAPLEKGVFPARLDW